SLFFKHRRVAKGYLAVTRGLIAIGAGDLRVARKAAEETARLSPRDPLALLLGAQSAQLAGDRSGAERAFRAMTAREDTRALGLRGLYIEAQRRNDLDAARRAAEEAAKLRPPVAWAGQAVLEYRCAAADWAGALDALDSMKGALAKPDYRRKRAVLLAARAQELEDTDRDSSRALVLESVKLAPDLVPAAALAGRRLAEAGDTRKARKVLEAAWAINPHPDLAESYADLRLGDSARERLARMQKLARKVPDPIEGAFAGRGAPGDDAWVCSRSRGARAASVDPNTSRRDSDGRNRGSRTWRRRARARMDDARHACVGRSGLDRGRRCVRPLAARVAERTARRVRMEGPTCGNRCHTSCH